MKNNNSLIDVHAHIHQHSESEWDEIVGRAAGAGVGSIITAGTTIEDSQQALVMAHKYTAVFAGVGVHPADLQAPLSPSDLDELNKMATDDQCVVMSEIGIDHMPNSPDHAWQEDAFAAQIEIAKQHQLPIVFHVREHGDDLSRNEARRSALSILKEQNAADESGGVAHYFQGDWEYAKEVLDAGFYISLAKPLLRMPELQDVARKAPIERIVLETDSYPQPFKKNRAKWTEPKDARLVAECLAQIRGVTLDEICRQTSENVRRMLGDNVECAGMNQS